MASSPTFPTPSTADAKIEFVSRDDPRALELIRHDAAHVLAEAVQTLWPGTQVTIGPVIENGFYYDFFRNEPFTPEDFPAIEAEMRAIIARDRPFTQGGLEPREGQGRVRRQGRAFKLELIDAIPDNQTLKIYKQGDWFDLCRGPHMTSTGKIGDAFKLMKVAGAYWRGDSNNPMLTRIYATAFAKKEDLDAYLHQIEEAEKRDHRRLGREMDLFHFQEEGPGIGVLAPEGLDAVPEAHSYMRRRLSSAGYEEVNAPQLLDKSLWETSGHWGWYQENMFAVKSAHAFMTRGQGASSGLRAEADELPGPRADLQARAEELSRPADAARRVRRGAPLRAVGRAARPDARARLHAGRRAHLLHRGADGGRVPRDQRPDPVDLRGLRLRRVVVKLSTRPEKRVGSDALWDRAEDVMKRVLEKIAAQSGGRIETSINPGEGAFYGPKFEYVLRDAIGRDWQCGTTQVDFNLPERFGAFYIGDGRREDARRS